MTKYLLSLLIVFSSSLKATEFYYMDADKKLHRIDKAFVAQPLRDMHASKWKEASKYIAVRPVKMDNGEYALRCHVRGFGGGPILGAIAYWGTKGVGYIGYGALCYFDPIAVSEAPHVMALIESAATAAWAAGTAAPTG